MRRGVPAPIWVQYAQVLAREGYTVERAVAEPETSWIVRAPDGGEQLVRLGKDGLWRLAR